MSEQVEMEEVYPEYFPDVRKWKLRGKSAMSLEELQKKFPGLKFVGYCPMTGGTKVIVPRAVLPPPKPAAPKLEQGRVPVVRAPRRFPRPPVFEERKWFPWEDELLLERHQVDGWSFSQIGRELSRTRNACVGRWHRLSGKRGCSG